MWLWDFLKKEETHLFRSETVLKAQGQTRTGRHWSGCKVCMLKENSEGSSLKSAEPVKGQGCKMILRLRGVHINCILQEYFPPATVLVLILAFYACLS